MGKGAKIKGNEFGYIGNGKDGWDVVWKRMDYAIIGHVKRVAQKRFLALGKEYPSREEAAKALTWEVKA